MTDELTATNSHIITLATIISASISFHLFSILNPVFVFIIYFGIIFGIYIISWRVYNYVKRRSKS